MPSVGGGFGNSYEIAFANLVGTIPQVTDVFNYHVTAPPPAARWAMGRSSIATSRPTNLSGMCRMLGE